MRSANGGVSRWLVMIAFSVVLLARIAVMQARLPELTQDPDNYRTLALALRDEHTFGTERDAFGKLIPTAFRPPLYPIVLALILPQDPTSWSWAIGGLQLMLGMATVWTTWRLALEYRLTQKTALLATCLVGIDPILLQQSSQVMTETLATLLAVVSLWQLSTHWRTITHRWYALVAGVMLGACVLCRPTFLPWIVLVGLVSFWHEAYRSRRFQGTLLLVLGVMCVIAPWMIRNWRLLGEPITTTTHGGSTLLRGNNPLYYAHLKNHPWGTIWNTVRFDQEWHDDFTRHHADTEIKRDRLAYERAWQAMHTEPSLFVCASLTRLSRLWGIVPWQVDPDERRGMRLLRYAVGGFYSVLLSLALVGVYALGWRIFDPPWCWSLLLVLVFTAVHSCYWTDMRMRAPLIPFVAVLAAVGCSYLANGPSQPLIATNRNAKNAP